MLSLPSQLQCQSSSFLSLHMQHNLEKAINTHYNAGIGPLKVKYHQIFLPSRYSTLTTTVWVKLLMKRPSYRGLEAEPAMKSPPWIHTMTGSGLLRGELKFTSTGTKMLRKRQSSLTFLGHWRKYSFSFCPLTTNI